MDEKFQGTGTFLILLKLPEFLINFKTTAAAGSSLFFILQKYILFLTYLNAALVSVIGK